MPLRDHTYRRVLTVGLLVLSVALAGQEVWRIALFDGARAGIVAVAASVVWVPVHLWHLHEGLRGRRPPGSGWTLALMAAVHVVAGLLIGSLWAFMLAALATSALVVLRPRAACAVLAACVAYAALLPLLGNQPDSPFSDPAYLASAVVVRSVLQFALVWLVAATYQLELARESLAAATVEHARRDLRAGIAATVDRNLATLVAAAADLPRADGPAARRTALAEVGDRARDLLAQVRALAAELRTDTGPADDGAERTRRALRSPVGTGFGTVARARRVPVVVASTIAAFATASGLGLYMSPPASFPWWLFVALCVVVAGGFGVAARDHLTGRPPGRRRLVAVVLVVLAAVTVDPDGGWYTVFVLATAVAVVALAVPARLRTGVLVAGVLAAMAAGAVDLLDEWPGWAVLAWAMAYTATLQVLVAGSLVGSVLLVRVTDRMHDVTDRLAVQAAGEERRRIGGELHDLLVQDLSAIALKTDLAARLTGRDDDAAAREIDEVEQVLRRRSVTMSALGTPDGAVSARTEGERAADLLRGFGVTVRLDLAPGALPRRQDELLGWALREGTANILRHSRARTATITLHAHHRGWALDMINDGRPQQAGADPGSGLASLAERFAGHHGWIRGAPSEPDHYRLRAELPAVST